MKEVFQAISSTVALLGIGGILGGYITFRLNRSKDLEFKRREQKEHRYKSAILFMDAYLEPKNMKYLNNGRAVMIHDDERDVAESLKAEYREMVLYAGRNIITALHDFLEKLSSESFAKVLLEMRKDLWEASVDLEVDELLLVSSKQRGI